MSEVPINPKLPTAGLPILSGSPKAKDPVCGMSVDPTKAAGKVEHKGKTYYFCSKGCAERFAQEPEKFLATPGAVGMEHAHGNAPAPASARASGGGRSGASRIERAGCALHLPHAPGGRADWPWYLPDLRDGVGADGCFRGSRG